MTQKRSRIEETPGLGLSPAPIRSARLDETPNAIADLRRITQASTGATVDACRRELNEAFALRVELDLMKDAIIRTRQEIAALHRSDSAGRGMRRVAGELDAVVGSTEAATSTILGAIEQIEANADMLRRQHLPRAAQGQVDAIQERVVVAYEACNFQDLTGQRIGKIVGVLTFIEEHLDRMIAVWSGLDGYREMLSDPAPEPIDDERALLNGPRLAQDAGHVDQSDIDALFG